MDIVLLGPPGAGKGTQAKRLQKELGLPHIASGDIFRAIGREDTPLAREVRCYMDRGMYVPDELTIKLVLDRLSDRDAKDGFLLDGFPRTIPQAEALDRALEESGRRVNLVLFITAPTDLLVGRICTRIVCPSCHAIYNATTRRPKNDRICDACGHELERRTDEDPNIVRVRLDTYSRQTQPLVDYYTERELLCTIDGSQPLDHVDATVNLCVRKEVA